MDMRSSLLAAATVCLLISACNRGPSGPVAENGPGGPEKERPSGDGLVIGEPIQYENLTVFPVTSKTDRNQDRFITLDEGLKSGTVEIKELGGGAGLPELPGDAPNPPAAPNQPGQQAAPAEQATNAPPELGEAAASANDDDSTAALIQPSDFEGLAPAARSENEDGAQTESEEEQEIAPESPPFEPAGDAPDGEQVLQGDQLPNPIEPPEDDSVQFAGDQVNTLLVINRSDRPLYLMPGEIIVGGSQDRTIGQELVIAPDGKPVPIDVFCVEHGRWGGREGQETASLLEMATQNSANAASVALSADGAPDEAAMQAGQGRFVASVGNVGKGARLAVQQLGDQGQVWDEVAKANASSGVQTESGAFTQNYVEAGAVKRLEPYIEKLQQPVGKTPRVVGVVVAINGKVESVDVFESTPLFRKLWPKLLKSFALDAANASEEKDAGKACMRDDAVAFFDEAAASQVQKSEHKQGVMLVHRDSDRVVTFSASAPQAGEADANESAGGFGGAVHASAFAK